MTASRDAPAPALVEFRERVRAWLEAHADAEGWRRDSASGIRADGDDPDEEQRGRRAQRLLFDAGFAGITWPVEFGGQGLGAKEQLVFSTEVAKYKLPVGQYTIGLGFLGPTLIAVGSPEQRDRYLLPMLRGEEIWCQCFSETEAGSDVAALRSRAVKTAQGWVLQGHKLWTSGAQRCQFGLVLARTDSTVPKHRGLSMFIVDLRSPGVVIRPIRQIDGRAHFNEIFFEDVAVPAENLVGAEGDGWQGAMTTLMNERMSLGALRSLDEVYSTAQLVEFARAHGLVADASVRQDLADLWSKERVVQLLADRVSAAILGGGVPGPEGSVAKLARSQYCKMSAALGARLAGEAAIAWSPDRAERSHWAETLLYVPALSLAGGTDEIQKNVIGERVLGLPKEPQVDIGIAFDALDLLR
jgi:alkylation response protein AidB-like acyl-CoA dehydrogenase